MSRDPIGFNGGTWNLYHYVGNEPISFIDPSGLGFINWLCCLLHLPCCQKSKPKPPQESPPPPSCFTAKRICNQAYDPSSSTPIQECCDELRSCLDDVFLPLYTKDIRDTIAKCELGCPWHGDNSFNQVFNDYLKCLLKSSLKKKAKSELQDVLNEIIEELLCGAE